MPVYEYRCDCGYQEEHYYSKFRDAPNFLRCWPCCNPTLGRIISQPAGGLYFEESRPRTIENLGSNPVTITSPKQHRQAMKAAGVSSAGGSKWV